MLKFTIGCDPELFLYDGNKGEYISALGLIPGDKKKPHRVKHGAVQVDGISAEFNIDPADSRDAFVDSTISVLKELKSMLPKGVVLRAVPTIHYGVQRYNFLPDEAKVLGCDPDYIGESRTARPPYERIADEFHGSGHIHVGWTKGEDPLDKDHFADCATMVGCLDKYFGWMNRSLYEGRRNWYGQPKVFRPKSYGVEYRTPSNSWLRSPQGIRYAYDLTTAAIEEVVSGVHHMSYDNAVLKKQNLWSVPATDTVNYV